MATAHGTFILHDRASRTLDRMQRKAAQTDATFKRLALTMDTVGDQGQVRQLDQYNRAAANLNRTSTIMSRDNDRVSRSFRAAGKEAETFGMRLRKLGANLISVTKIIGLLKLPAMAALFGAAAQGVSALAGSLVTLLPKLADLWGIIAPLPAAMVALGGAMITAKLAFADLGKAMGGNKEALKELTPEARRLLQTLKLYQPVMKELRQSAQRGLFPGVDFAIRRLQRGVPAAKEALGMFGRALGALAREGATRFTAGTFLRDFVQLAGHGSSILRRLGRAVFDIIEGLMDFALAARPFTNWLVNTVVGWVKLWKETMRTGRETGELQKKLERTKQALITFGHILRNLWGFFKALGQASRQVGDSLWKDAEKATAAWKRFATSPAGQVRLRRDFAIMARNLHAVNRLLGAIGRAFWRMGTRPEFTQMINTLTKAVPHLERFLNTAARQFGPVLVDLLLQILRILEKVMGATGPMVLFLQAVADLLGMFNNLLDRSQTLTKVFTTLFSVFLISRFVGWAMKLAKAFLGIQTAAAATATTMGRAPGGAAGGARGRVAGALGGIGGFFGVGGRGRGGPRPSLARTGTQRPGRMSRIGGAAGRFGGPAALIGGLAASAAPNETLANIGMMTATGAMVGSMFGPPGMLIGGGIGAATGAVMSSFGPSEDPYAKILGPDSKIGQRTAMLTRSAKTPEMAARQEAGLRRLRTEAQGAKGDSPILKQWKQMLTDEIAARKSFITGLKRTKAEEAKGRGLNLANRLIQQYGGQAQMMEGKGVSQVDIAKVLRRQLLRDMQLPGLGRGGKLKLSEAVIKQMIQVDISGKGGKGFDVEVKKTIDTVEKKFGTGKTTINRHTGEIKRVTVGNFNSMATDISRHAERANTNVTASFQTMLNNATSMLTAMGYTPAEAASLVNQARTGQVPTVSAGGTNQGVPNPVDAIAGRTFMPGTGGGGDMGTGAFGPAVTGGGGGGGRGGGGGGGRSDVDPGLWDELSLASSLGMSVISAHRTGATVRGSNRQSLHSYYPSRAIDVATGSSAGQDDPVMRSFFNAMVGRPGISEAILSPLIYSPGRGVHAATGTALADHWNHVHVGIGAAGAGAGGPGAVGGLQIGNVPVPPIGLGGMPGLLGQAATAQLGAGLTAGINKQLAATMAPGGLTGMPGMPVGGAAGGGSLGYLSSLWVQAGGNPAVAQIAAAIAMGESGGNPLANLVSSVEDSRGLWQINTYAHPWAQNLYDPLSNARAAVQVYNQSGGSFSPWSVYTSGKYQDYLSGGGGGDVDFGGWFGRGGSFKTSRPTLIGVGESGEETVTVSRGGGGTPVGVAVHIGTIENHREGDVRRIIHREISAALNDLANEIEIVPMAKVPSY